MRADTEVTFVTLGKQVYDENTGDYVVTDDVINSFDAYVTDTGTERMTQLYGTVRSNAKTIRVNEVIDGKFDHIIIGGQQFKSDRRKIYRHKTVFEVSGV